MKKELITPSTLQKMTRLRAYMAFFDNVEQSECFTSQTDNCGFLGVWNIGVTTTTTTSFYCHILLSIQLTNEGIFVQQINFIPQQEGGSLIKKISGFINLIVSIFPLLPQLHFRLLAISPVPSAVSNIGWHCTGNFSQAVIRPNLMVHTTIKA